MLIYCCQVPCLPGSLRCLNFNFRFRHNLQVVIRASAPSLGKMPPSGGGSVSFISGISRRRFLSTPSGYYGLTVNGRWGCHYTYECQGTDIPTPAAFFFREMHKIVYRPLAGDDSKCLNYPFGWESQRRTPQSPSFAVAALGISIAYCLDGYSYGKSLVFPQGGETRSIPLYLFPLAALLLASSAPVRSCLLLL